MNRTVIGVDVDLHRIHAVAVGHPIDMRQIVMLNSTSPVPLFDYVQDLVNPLVLIECASPHQYGGRLFKKKLSWMIYNSALMGTIAAGLSTIDLQRRVEVRVSPSSTWTKGFPEQVRHKMAGVDTLFTDRNKEDAHNLRECLAMVWFYTKTPDNWTTVNEFLRDL